MKSNELSFESQDEKDQARKKTSNLIAKQERRLERFEEEKSESTAKTAIMSIAAPFNMVGKSLNGGITGAIAGYLGPFASAVGLGMTIQSASKGDVEKVKEDLKITGISAAVPVIGAALTFGAAKLFPGIDVGMAYLASVTGIGAIAGAGVGTVESFSGIFEENAERKEIIDDIQNLQTRINENKELLIKQEEAPVKPSETSEIKTDSPSEDIKEDRQEVFKIDRDRKIPDLKPQLPKFTI
jgi:hypothetical protein